jgi:hypothetical protein
VVAGFGSARLSGSGPSYVGIVTHGVGSQPTIETSGWGTFTFNDHNVGVRNARPRTQGIHSIPAPAAPMKPRGSRPEEKA